MKVYTFIKEKINGVFKQALHLSQTNERTNSWQNMENKIMEKKLKTQEAKKAWDEKQKNSAIRESKELKLQEEKSPRKETDNEKSQEDEES